MVGISRYLLSIELDDTESLVQTRRLRFFGHVARMSDSQDTFRALHTSTRELPKDWRRRPGRPRHTWLRTLNADLHPLSAQSRTQLSMATCPGQRTMEATRGNGYAPAWGSLVMIMMIEMALISFSEYSVYNVTTPVKRYYQMMANFSQTFSTHYTRECKEISQMLERKTHLLAYRMRSISSVNVTTIE